METEEQKKKYTYSPEKIKEYNRRFMEAHKDDKFLCEQCLKTYSYFNRYHHVTSKFHQNSLKIIEKYEKP